MLKIKASGKYPRCSQLIANQETSTWKTPLRVKQHTFLQHCFLRKVTYSLELNLPHCSLLVNVWKGLNNQNFRFLHWKLGNISKGTTLKQCKRSEWFFFSDVEVIFLIPANILQNKHCKLIVMSFLKLQHVTDLCSCKLYIAVWGTIENATQHFELVTWRKSLQLFYHLRQERMTISVHMNVEGGPESTERGNPKINEAPDGQQKMRI
jgi:hypothetical protein